jgi:hypothetical protein
MPVKKKYPSQLAAEAKAEPVQDQAPEPTATDSVQPAASGKPDKKWRYEVSLAKEKEPNCYVRFSESNTLEDAKQKCIDRANKEGRECIVWDNDGWGNPIIFRHGKKEAGKETPKEATDEAAATTAEPPRKHKVSRR